MARHYIPGTQTLPKTAREFQLEEKESRNTSFLEENSGRTMHDGVSGNSGYHILI
jgi:hypothetical protein